MRAGCMLWGRSWPLWTSILLLLGESCGFASHSLNFHQVIWDFGQGIPTFQISGYIDNEPWGQYESITQRVLPRGPWIKKAEEDDPTFWEWNTERATGIEKKFRGDLLLRKHIIQSDRFLIWQESSGCGQGENGSSRAFARYGYNGRDFLSLDLKTLTWIVAYEAAEVIKKEWEVDTAYSQAKKARLESNCFPWLQKLLKYKEEALQKVSPAVKISFKRHEDGLKTLTCHAHGFYPKEIDATWRKDGKFLEQNFSGVVSPNSDGTFYTCISINVDPKDGGSYQCHVQHASLTEPLVTSWQKLNSPVNLVGVILGVVASVLVLAGTIFFVRKCQAGCKAPSSV
ncbi:major histocompatibility complex class I-related gene protein-like isoform X2 [Varanus komodoensis]|uniref:major histocompatibility complex class I-related gene protein-like isoform X2 n=1 Tax=Varanus komodoensis TaxID=61221 RepID=UPI001CF7C98D|nr:major histocompatibility complex class I-related gene protein-like isoform X2 [Varanus komodoensis]